jgi:hypothetical protein
LQIATCCIALSSSIATINIGPINEGVAPEKNHEDFQKGLDAISRFAAKGCSPDDVYTCARDVKKQTSPPVKAHLLRSALVLLSLLAICAMPFALAQRNLAKPSISKPAAQPIPAVPRVPDVILYDQLNSPGSQSTNSQGFEAGFASLNDFAADDLVVPVGQTWAIAEVDIQGVYFNCSNPCGPANSFNVYFYQDFGGLPGPTVGVAISVPYVNNSGVFQVPLPSPFVLTSGTYWVSVQANMSSTNGHWGWTDRAVQANSPAVWQNPGGGFNSCLTWGARTACVGDAAAPDQMFRLIGAINGGTPSPTPTGTPSPTATPSATECPRPTPGTCTSYEAESDNNTLGESAFVLSCPACSNGLKVGYVGSNDGTLQFNAVGVVATGNYTVTICYTNGDAVRYALLSVNGGQGTPLSFPSTGSFQTVGSIQTTITLNTGCNTLEFYNPIVGDWAPDFDRIQFNCPTCTVSAPDPTQCSILQKRLERLQLRRQQLRRLDRSNKKLNRRIRRLRSQLQLQGCL